MKLIEIFLVGDEQPIKLLRAEAVLDAGRNTLVVMEDDGDTTTFNWSHVYFFSESEVEVEVIR